MVPEHVFHVALHLVKGAQYGAVAGVAGLQGLQAGVGGVHVEGVGAAFQQGVHEGVDKAVVELGKIRFGQAGDEQGEAGGIVHHENALPALQQDQVGVPAGKGAAGHRRALGEPGDAFGGRKLALGVEGQFGAEFLGGVEEQHGTNSGEGGKALWCGRPPIG